MGLMAMMCARVEAQNGFNLPYSQVGLGVYEQPFNMPSVARMGGVVYTRFGNSIINPFNPASYSGIGMESLVFDMGVNMQLSTTRSGSSLIKDADGDLGYLAMGLPVTKWLKVAFGLMPYSTVDYMTVIPAATAGGMKTVYEGAGGANEAFIGMSFSLLDNKKNSMAVGFNLNYLTGSIQRLLSYVATDSLMVNSRKAQELRLGNAFLDFGVQYRHALGQKYTIGLGIVYSPYMKSKLRENTIIYTYQGSNETILDTVFPSRGNEVEGKSMLEHSHTVGVGLSLERNGWWQVAADITFAGWQGMRHIEVEDRAILGTGKMNVGAFRSYALGFEKLVNMDASKYIGRMGFSIGTYMQQGLMYVTTDNGERRVDQWGVGAGLTFPMRRGRSLLTVSAAYSMMGDKDLMQRECVTFGIALSCCERWFVKRKYN